MDQRPWRANSSWASQENPSILCKPNVHCRAHNSLPTVPILSHIQPVHELPCYFRSILKLSAHLYLVLPSGSYLLVSPPQPYAFLVSPICVTCLTNFIFPHLIIQSYYSTLQYTVLHCTALHYTVLHCTTLHYSTLHCITLYYTALHYTALNCTELHYTAQHYITLRCTALHYTTRYHGGFHMQLGLWEEQCLGIEPREAVIELVNGGQCGRRQRPVCKHTLVLEARLRKIRDNLRRVAY